jgi:hypothetical protein
MKTGLSAVEKSQFFSMSETKILKKTIVDVKNQDIYDINTLHSDIPEVMQFYSQLSEREKMAHIIAVEKLGTSYDVIRTHGFQKWKRKQITS